MAVEHTLNGAALKNSLFDFVCNLKPGFSKDSKLTVEEVNQFRQLYLEKMMLDERKELSQLEEEVLKSMRSNSILSENISLTTNEQQTFGQRVADRIASFGGSWLFILSFFTVLLSWIILNLIMASKAFDPYPFILLNLVLSCLAAIQAPIIMMSQNRQEEKDRLRAENDFKINLKAELELRLLHEKMDHLLVHQHQRLLEIQEMQVEYLQEIARSIQSRA